MTFEAISHFQEVPDHVDGVAIVRIAKQKSHCSFSRKRFRGSAIAPWVRFIEKLPAGYSSFFEFCGIRLTLKRLLCDLNRFKCF